MALPLLAGGLIAGGLIGSLTQKTPKYDMSAMKSALDLIEKQYADIESYFAEAGSAFEEQYKGYYGEAMQGAVSQLANQGIYESPVGEKQLTRTRTALGEQYATAKSQLAGQKMSALGAVDQQKIGYYQNLAQLQYQKQLAKQQKKGSIFGTMGGLGGALLGL